MVDPRFDSPHHAVLGRATWLIQTNDLVEDVTENGSRIRRFNRLDLHLNSCYAILNKQCFNNALPGIPVYWAEHIDIQPDHLHSNAVYVPGDSVIKDPYIAIDDCLAGKYPLDQLCLLHEMVHVRIGPEFDHGEVFIAEFKRALDANKWEVMGCIDAPRFSSAPNSG